MNIFIQLFLTFSFLYKTNGISVKIDGSIDLGPNWNYQYKVHHLRDMTATEKATTLQPILYTRLSKAHKIKKIKSYGVTQMLNNDTKPKHKRLKINRLFDKSHKVKEDAKIKDFTLHVFRQNLKVFDAIKDKITDEGLKDEVNFLSKKYEDKFRRFINETQNHKIKTRLGSQKVILNTIDTSNLILRRLVNYLIGDMDKRGILRNFQTAANVFEKEVNREIDLEYAHACKKFGICRSKYGFSDFLVDLLTEVLRNNDAKFKQASDAMTEVLKNEDYAGIMDTKTEKSFKRKILRVESLSSTNMRPIFMIIKNAIANKNRPIAIMQAGLYAENVIALLDGIDILDKKLSADEKNQLEWNDIKNSLRQWSNGQRSNVLEVMQTFIDHVKRGINGLDEYSASELRHRIAKIIE